MFELVFTPVAQGRLESLEKNPAKTGLVKQTKKTLGFLQTNPKHPSLNTHVYHSLEHPFNPKEKVFEAYAQQNTPSAYRIFWCYGPKKGQITIIAITPHP
jgi:hypothetical protein